MFSIISRSTVGMLVLVCVVGIARGLIAEELPKELKSELTDLQAQFARIESRLPRIDIEKSQQSIRAVAQWVDEFSLDAELLEDDPLLAKLNERVKDLEAKLSAEAEDRKSKQTVMNKPKRERVDIDSLLKIPVNLQNVSFKKDVAPIIANACMGCHNPQRMSGEFDSSTFNKFVAMIEPGDPDNSHILNLVTGKAEPRMPRGGQTTFKSEWVDIWTAWIKQGAKFDGGNKGAPITDYMIDLETQRRQVLAKLDTETLEKIHLSEAYRHIDIVSPDKEVHTYEAPNVLAFTTLRANDAEYIAWLAEAVLEELQLRFDVSQNFRGKLGVTVFADRFDYLAFAQEVDEYSPEPSQFGHVRLRPEYQYVAITADHPEYTLDGVVAQTVAEAFLQSLGNRRLPSWAIHGVSRHFASKFEGRQKSKAFATELKNAYDLATAGRGLANVFNQNTAWVEVAPLSASFFDFAFEQESKKTVTFLKALAQSGNVQGALNQGFGASPAQVSQAWVNWLRKNKR